MQSVTRMTSQERYRKKISEGNILDRLLKHFHNQLRVPLDNGQVMLGIKLVGKVLPDLQSIEVSGAINVNVMNRLELDARMITLGRDPSTVWASIDKPLPVIEHVSPEPQPEPDEQPVEINDSE